MDEIPASTKAFPAMTLHVVKYDHVLKRTGRHGGTRNGGTALNSSKEAMADFTFAEVDELQAGVHVIVHTGVEFMSLCSSSFVSLDWNKQDQLTSCLTGTKKIEGVVESSSAKLGKVGLFKYQSSWSLSNVGLTQLLDVSQFPVKTKEGKTMFVARTSLEINHSAQKQAKFLLSLRFFIYDLHT